MKHLYKIAIVLLVTVSLAQAADFRIWTSSKGTSVEAQLLAYKDNTVKLATKAPKELTLQVKDLSLADRQYLIDYAGAKPEVVLVGEPSVPELNFKKPKPFLEKLERVFSPGEDSELTFELYETEHFLFAVEKGVRITGIAETAEACWHGMAFQHFEFRENWGTTKKLIIIFGERETYTALGQWYISQLRKAGRAEVADRIGPTWDKSVSNKMGVSAENVKEFKIKTSAQIFAFHDTKKLRKKFNPTTTHSISVSLFNHQAVGVSSVSDTGYFGLMRGHSYYKEIQLCKKTDTNLIADDYEGGLSTKSGFADGSGWAKELKKLVKKGKVEPSLVSILSIEDPRDLTPEKTVLMYSLSYYMQSTQANLASYAKLIRLISTSNQIPEKTEFVKIFGFDTIEDFEKGWREFIISKDFK